MEDRNKDVVLKNTATLAAVDESVRGLCIKVGILQDKLQDLVRLIGGPDCSNLECEIECEDIPRPKLDAFIPSAWGNIQSAHYTLDQCAKITNLLRSLTGVNEVEQIESCSSLGVK